MKKYTLTKEHKAKLKPWTDRWIANAMSTKEMNAEDREAMRKAILGMYSAAKLSPPKHIVFVSSPLIAALSGSFAAGIWWLSRNGWMLPGGLAATYDATRAATRAATDAATYDATRAATDDATDAATDDATDDATDVLCEYTRFLLACCNNYYSMWNGGNQWSGLVSFLSFFKDVAKLNINEYDAYQHYESAAIHGGPRMMHTDFCIVSDRPEVLKVDEQNRPHCEDGPSHRWRDGLELHYWHGVKVEKYVIEKPEMITVEDIEKENNAEVRRIKILRRGAGWYLNETKAELVDMDSRNCIGGTTRALFKDKSGEKWLCGTDGSTKRVYYMPVPKEVVTCKQAHESICGFSEDNIIAES